MNEIAPDLARVQRARTDLAAARRLLSVGDAAIRGIKDGDRKVSAVATAAYLGAAAHLDAINAERLLAEMDADLGVDVDTQFGVGS